MNMENLLHINPFKQCHHTKRIKNRNIPFCLIGATNQMLDNYDCASSEKIILMNKDEHMPWMKETFRVS